MFGRRKTSNGTNWKLVGGLVAGGATLIPLVPVIKNRAMDITRILKKDHRMVSGMIMTLEMTPWTNSKVRSGLFEQIRYQLTVHAQAEEEVLYPVLKNLLAGEDSKISDAYREHQIIKDTLSDMRSIDPTTGPFDAKLAELRRNIEHHVDEEEGEIFQYMKDRLSAEQLQELGHRFHDRKKLLKTKIAA
jgi:hemerythrin superfamily protein